MKKWSMICVFVIAVAILTACGAEKYEILTPQTLHDVIDIAALRREAIVKPDYSTILSLTEGRNREDFFRMSIFYCHTHLPRSTRPYITIYDAISDMWSLHRLMRQKYGGYVYFGGDDVFIPLFEALEAELLGYGCDVIAEFFGIKGDEITPEAFAAILRWRLNAVINDVHFRIYNGSLSWGYGFFHSLACVYDRSDRGFINRKTGLLLTAIEGHEIEDIMKLHVDYDGRLFYSPVFIYAPFHELLFDDALYDFIVIYQEELDTPKFHAYFVYEDMEPVSRIFTEKEIEFDFEKTTPLPSLEFIDGIPVVTVMVMGFDGSEISHGFEHVAPFLSFAEYLCDEPVVIVDLRGNEGGNGHLPTRWLYMLTGEMVWPNYVSLGTMPFFLGSLLFRDAPYAQKFMFNQERLDCGHVKRNFGPREIVERDQLLIVLTDRWTGSAGEGFVDAVFNITNTLVIGTPTRGVLAFDMTYPHLRLPETSIPFGFGTTMNVWPEGHFAESVGILPDLWVEGDALVAALALLRGAGFGDEIIGGLYE